MGDAVEEYKDVCEKYKEEVNRHKNVGEAILADFNNAKKIGQKQI
jgi:hypothetical protein